MSLAAPARAEAGEHSISDRFLAAVPLISVFLWLCLIYAWEAWRHGTPWLFGDELEFTQLARAIAATGHAARRGQPHSFDSIYTYLMAPAWILGNARHAYAAVKDMNVVLMTATIFPTYGIARFVVGRPAALFAAAAAGVIPSLVYTSMVVEENVAYPYATLCLFLIMGALLRRTRWWIGGAVVACLFAPAVRGELVVIPAVFAFAALLLAWQSRPMRRRWRRWSTSDWVGFAVLVVGACVLLSALLGHAWQQWLIATGFYKDRVFRYGMQAAGALTIGLGVFPVVAGLASLWRGPHEVYRPGVRVFRCVLLSAVVIFWTYTAVKAAFLSTVFGTYIVERNLIYICPLLFVGTALWLERRSLNPIAVVVAAFATLYLIVTTPYKMDSHFYSQAPGLSLFQWLNRTTLGFTPNEAKGTLLVILVATVAILIGIRYVPRLALPIALLAAAFVIVWNGGGELAAASASNSIATTFLSNIRGNPTWLDKATHGQPTLYLGQQMTPDQNGEWLLEFWNRSIKQVWSLDGTAQGPGPVLTPNVHRIDGTLDPNPHYPYVIAETGIEIAGHPVAIHYHRAGGGLQKWTLYRVSEPLRLRGAVTGLTADGWSVPGGAAYTRYSTAGGGAGTMRILVSRQEVGEPTPPAKVTIRMGLTRIGSDKEPHLGKITAVRHWVIRSHESRVFYVPAPGPRFRVEVDVEPTFVPAELDPTSGDRRHLGASLKFTFVPPRHGRS